MSRHEIRRSLRPGESFVYHGVMITLAALGRGKGRRVLLVAAKNGDVNKVLDKKPPPRDDMTT